MPPSSQIRAAGKAHRLYLQIRPTTAPLTATATHLPESTANRKKDFVLEEFICRVSRNPPASRSSRRGRYRVRNPNRDRKPPRASQGYQKLLVRIRYFSRLQRPSHHPSPRVRRRLGVPMLPSRVSPPTSPQPLRDPRSG